MATLMATLLTSFGAAAGTASTLGTALSAASIALPVIGGIQQAGAARAAGRQAQQQAEAEAKQAQAISQREALDRRQEGALLESRQRALAAAQGGSTDPSILNLIGQTAADTERAVQTSLYQGTAQAQGARYRGQVAQAQSRFDATGAILGGIGGGVGAASSAYSRFGEKPDTRTTSGNYRYG